MSTTWAPHGTISGDSSDRTFSSFYDVLRLDLQVNLSNTIPADDFPIRSDGREAFAGTGDDLHIAQLSLQAIRVGTYAPRDQRDLEKNGGGTATIFIESNSIDRWWWSQTIAHLRLPQRLDCAKVP